MGVVRFWRGRSGLWGEVVVPLIALITGVFLWASAAQVARPEDSKHCGCKAKDCERPCTVCCEPGPCPCGVGDPTGTCR